MYKAIPVIQETAAELRELQKRERHRLKQQRLHALYLLASGQARERQQVAALLGVSRNSVARWLDRYAAGGLEAMLRVQAAPGQAGALSPKQVGQLREALARPEGFGSYGEVQEWIAEQLGVEMSYWAVHKLVRYKLDAGLKVPRPSHPKKTNKP